MYIRVSVTADAKRERVSKVSDTEFQIAVREPALQNMANTRIRELIAREYGVSVSKVRILTGHHSRVKMIVVDV
jgi:uncharacterized protein YggU (UPF0235/DUF167 family)